MTTIRQDDVIQSVADALQYISYYHSADFIQAMAAAYEREASPAAKDAIKQILVNSRMCAQGHRPICQDTGIVTVFARVGMNVRWDASVSLTEMINEGVRRAYNHPDNKLRGSSPTRHSIGRTRATTRQRSFTWKSCRATQSKSPWPPRAAARRTRRS
jgi:fumarate hydratase class I